MKKSEAAKILALLDKKQGQVDVRLRTLESREREIKDLEAELDRKLGLLQEERKFFTETVQKEKDVAKERLDSLVELYSKMPPKKAGPIFEEMNRDLVVAMFKALPEKQVSLILAAMSPEKSVKTSEYYSRIKSGREYDLLKELNQTLKNEFKDCK